MQGVYSWQWHHCKKIFRWFRSVTHSSDFVTILICTTTTNPTTTKKGAELGKNPTQHSLTPFGQSWVVLARSQKTIRNLQVFFACKLDHRRPWFWKIVCWISMPLCGCVFFFENTKWFYWACSGPHINIKESGDGGGKHSLILANQWNMILILDSRYLTLVKDFIHFLLNCFIFQGTSGFLKFIQCRDAPMSWPPFSGTARHSLKLRCAGKSTPCSLICLSAICVNV